MLKQGDRLKAEERHHRRVINSDNLVVMRLDGKAFHTYTRGLRRPFDLDLQACMRAAMLALCEEIQGVRLAYCQSDEISLLLSAGDNPASELWMGGVEAKMLSISASIATAHFNKHAAELLEERRLALFDSRIALTYPKEGLNSSQVISEYFDWRRWDCQRNSVTMVAQSFYSHQQLENKSYRDRVAMIEEATGQEDWWGNYSPGCMSGVYAHKVVREEEVSYVRSDSGERHTTTALRSHWRADAFTEPTIKVVSEALSR